MGTGFPSDEITWSKRGLAAVKHMRVFSAVMTALIGLLLILNLVSAAGLGGESIMDWLGLPPANGRSISILSIIACGGLILHGAAIWLLKFFRLE